MQRTMFRWFSSAIVSCLVFGGLVPGALNAQELRLYNWADYIDPEMVSGFTDETDIPVRLDTYAEADIAEANLLTNRARHDLAIVPLSMLPRLLQAGAIQPLDRSRFSFVSELDPQIMAMMDRVDPRASEYTLLYLWGSVGLVYDEQAVRTRVPDAPLDSWDLIFDPKVAKKLSDCGIGMVDSVEDVTMAALAYLGRGPLSITPEDQDAAFEAIRAITPYVKRFDSSSYDDLMKRELCVALTWNSEGIAAQLEQENSPYRYVIPESGGFAWFDVLVLPAGAQNSGAVDQFIEFLHDPEWMAANADWGYSASALPAARQYMWESARKHPALFPSPEELSRMQVPQALSGAEKAALDARWRRVMLGM